MSDKFQHQLRQFYDCNKDKKPYFHPPTGGNLRALFVNRTRGLHLEDFFNIKELPPEKKAKLESLNPEDLTIIQKFLNGKVANQTALFKPFSQFLQNKTRKLRDAESADFLAFLLDFPYRPYSKSIGKEYICPDESEEVKKEPEPGIEQAPKDAEPPISEESTPVTSEKKPLTVPLWLLILGIIILTVLVLGALKNIFQPQPVKQINIGNKTYNTQNYYYYYRDSGQIKIISREELSKDNHKQAHPVTPVIFDEFFSTSGIDTTQKEYKLFKTRYFQNKSLPKVINIDTGEEDTFKIHKVKRITNDNSLRQAQPRRPKETYKKQINLNIKILDNNNQFDDKIADLLREKLKNHNNKASLCRGKSMYTYKKSDKFAERNICTVDLDYQILSDKNEILDNQHYHISGTGFSEENARENALMKLKTLIKP